MLSWGVNLDHLPHRVKGNRSTSRCVTVTEGQTQLKRAQLGVKDKREDTRRNVTFTRKCAQQEAGGGGTREGSILAGEIRQ